MLRLSNINAYNITYAKGEYEKIMKRFFSLVLACLIISSSLPSMASANSSTSLINSARTYLGVKYTYGGTTSSGFDCSGYTQRAFQDVGITIPRTTSQQYATGTPVAKDNLKTGDLVFFNTDGKGASHVGIYVGSSRFIHASTSQGVMISSINDPYYWGSRYLGARRVTDFTEASTVAAEIATPSLYPTRADIAETLVKELGLTAKNTTTSFNDVSPNDPQLKAIIAVAEAGIFTGLNGSFNPDGHLTRAQLAKVLVEAFDLEGNSDFTFKDVTANHWAKGYIGTLYKHEITTGYGNGYFGVNDYVTLTQFKTFIKRINE